MRKHAIASGGFLALLLAAAGIATVSAQTGIRHRPIRNLPAGDGAEMYAGYCASCHGNDGKGAGPAAAALKTRPADLTALSARNNGEFPVLRLMNTLGNMETGEVHGSTEMPVWGQIFRDAGDSASVARVRVYNLVNYLQAIQTPAFREAGATRPAKEPERRRLTDPDPTSGAAMYVAYCASCHGADGRGFGPAAKALTRQLPDLTVLSRTHDGKFPSAHIAEVLDLRGGAIAAHGSREMPVWGGLLRESGEGRGKVHIRIANLVDYLKSIQQ